MIEVRLSSPHSRDGSPSEDSDGFRRTVTMSFGPKSLVDSNRLNYLARPKQEYEPLDVFKHQEFRGLLHADHKEAVSIAQNEIRKSAAPLTSRFVNKLIQKRKVAEALINNSQSVDTLPNVNKDLPQVQRPHLHTLTQDSLALNTYQLEELGTSQESLDNSILRQMMPHSKARSQISINPIGYQTSSAVSPLVLLSARTPGEIRNLRRPRKVYRPPYTGRVNTMANQSNIEQQFP